MKSIYRRATAVARGSRRRLAALSLLALGLVAAAGPASAQTQLRFGVSASRSLGQGEVHRYVFTGNVGEVVLLRMGRGSGNLWPRLQLFDPLGKLVKSTYDSSS